MTKIAAVLIAVMLIIVFAGALFLYYSWQRSTGSEGSTRDTGSQTQQPTLKAILKVDGYVSDGHWSRNSTTDLPDYSSNMAYSVSNNGNLAATNVAVTITVNGQLFTNNMVPSLATSDRDTYYFSLSTPYDSTSTVQIQATCQDSTDSYTLTVGSMFPRYFPDDPNVVKLFITPKEANVVNMKNSIVQAKFFLTPDWIALRDWVGSNIQYRFDNVSHGQGEYWQFSRETLTLRTGDCEDSAILLCSLLRAAEVPATDVYVVVGEAQGVGHAWVSFKLFSILGQDSWVRMEPTAGGNMAVDFFADLFSTFEGREMRCSFNDVYYSGSS